MKPKAVITHWIHDHVARYLSDRCAVVLPPANQTMSREELLRNGPETEALMVFLPVWVDRDLLDAFPKLKIISSGFVHLNNVDVEECTKRGIWFTTVPDMRANAAAELTVGLLIGMARRMPEGDRFIRSGKFSGWRPSNYGTGLAGKTAGIIGVGAVGQAVARRLSGFDMKLVYADPNPLPKDREYALKASRLSLDDLLATSDFIILCVPLSQGTRHLVNASTIAKMKRGAFIVNSSRGSVVDEPAVAAALTADMLGGYASDVFEMEDAMKDGGPQKTIPAELINAVHRTFFTPHIGSAVEEVRAAIEMEAARNIVQALNGERPQGAANQPEISWGNAGTPYF